MTTRPVRAARDGPLSATPPSGMARHCGVGVLPARPRTLRDEAEVENGVRLGQSYSLGRLHGQTVFSCPAICTTR